MQVKVQTLTGKQLVLEVCSGPWGGTEGQPEPLPCRSIPVHPDAATVPGIPPTRPSARCPYQAEPSCTVLEFKHKICDSEGVGIDWYVQRSLRL